MDKFWVESSEFAIPHQSSDAALLIPEQIVMLAGITIVFCVPVEKASLAAMISGTIGIAGTTALGKTVVSGLLKCIPGFGSVVGGVISGAAAAALTAALGEAYILILMKVCKGEMNVSDLNTDVGKQEIKKIFREQLKVKRDKDGMPIE